MTFQVRRAHAKLINYKNAAQLALLITLEISNDIEGEIDPFCD
jgi:hypothetical protein